MTRRKHLSDLARQKQHDADVIRRWLQGKQHEIKSGGIPKIELPTTTFNIAGFDPETTRLVEATLRSKPCIRMSYQRIHGIEINPADVARVDLNLVSNVGRFRNAHSLHTFLGKGRKKDEVEPALMLKVQLDLGGGNLEGHHHQVSSTRFTSDRSLVRVGGLWAMDDGRILLIHAFPKGRNYYDAIYDPKTTRKQKRAFDRSLVYSVVDYWNAMDEVMISDLNGFNLMVMEDQLTPIERKVEIIDRGKPEKMSPGVLLAKTVNLTHLSLPELDQRAGGFTDDWQYMGLMDAILKRPKDSWRSEMETEDVFLAVKDAIGRKTTQFFRRIYGKPLPVGEDSYINPKFDREIVSFVPALSRKK